MSNEFFNLVALIVLVFDCVFLITFLEDTKSNHRENRNNSNNRTRKEDDDEKA